MHFVFNCPITFDQLAEVDWDSYGLRYSVDSMLTNGLPTATITNNSEVTVEFDKEGNVTRLVGGCLDSATLIIGVYDPGHYRPQKP